jgi:hypothetical protein
MDLKQFFKKNYIHFIAIGVFLVIGASYFSMQLGNEYALKQHDVESHKGASAEIVFERNFNGENAEWNNSMFGGMPATLISPQYEGNVMKTVLKVWNKTFPSPLGIFLMHLISFYIFALCLRIKPIIGIIGAFAFAFMSYEIVILQAGHNTKAMAVAFLPAILGAFIMTFRNNWKLGALLSTLFMGLEIAANHLQVTYYMSFVLLFVGIYFLVEAIRNKTYKEFAISTGALIGGYIIALMINYGPISSINGYSEYSMRGPNDLKSSPRGEAEAKEGGLEIDYITNWSLDRGETFTFFSPYVRGSHSAPFEGSRFEYLEDEVEFDAGEREFAAQLGMYWGNQPGTSGPFYMGVIVMLLAFLALLFVRKPIVYILFGISIFMVLLSWGKNLMGLTEFFVENIPLYNKFRTVTIILVIVELCMPVLAVFFLHHLYENRDKIKAQKKLFYIGSGAFLVFLFGLKFTGGSFTGASDDTILLRQEMNVRNQIQQTDAAELAEMGIDKNNPEQINQVVERQLEPIQKGIDGAKKMRKEMYAKSTTRSILFALLGVGILALFFFTSISSMGLTVALGVLILIDMVPVNLNYLGSDEDVNGDSLHWMDKGEKLFPIASTAADQKIMDSEIQENSELQKIVEKGARFGKETAESMELEGDVKRRVIDFYKFRALASATNYRVLDLSGGWSGAWNSSKNAYLHKALGGYHGAKLRVIQNIFDFHLSNSNNLIMDMMNVKYIIRGNDVNVNDKALGNGWAIKNVKSVEDNDAQIRSLGKSFDVVNQGEGTLLVNGKPVKEQTVYGFEDLAYVLKPGDTTRVPLSNGITPGKTALAVMDAKGSVNLVPEITLQMDTLNSFVSLVKITGKDDFDPSNEVVLLGDEAKKLSSKAFSGEAKVTMTSYNPDRMEYTVDADGKQFIVFSEIYYPSGWKATVDGKEVDIYRANYMLRGIQVDGGKHTVVFEYVTPGSGTAKTIAWIGSILLLLAIAGLIILHFRKNKETEVNAA